MSFLITRRPEKLFTGSIKFSRWTGIANSYNFELQRVDYPIKNTAIRNAYSTTLPTIWLNGDPLGIPLFIYVGDEIYVNSGVYQGVFTVAAVNGAYITIDTPFIGNGSSGHLNMVQRLTNFKSYIKVYHGVTGQLIDTYYSKPDGTGLLLQDVSGAISSIVDTQFNAIQSQINRPNTGISGSFTIRYGATYKFIFPSLTIDLTIPEVKDNKLYYWSSAAKQIDGNTSLGMNGVGQNLKEYVPKNIVSSAAKFLTAFERPTYFEGFPFFLSFIYDDDFDVNYLERHQQDVNVNGASVGAETNNNLFVNGRGYVNQMNIRTPNTGAKAFDVWLEVGDVIVDGYVEAGYVDLGYSSNFVFPFP
jgi:hypothetical protein